MTIKDIAKKAGVSTTTVSLILNNKDKSISDETREKVLRVVKEYDFKPYAKVLQNPSTRSGLVGIMVPNNASIYSEFVSGAEAGACTEGYSSILCTTQCSEDDIVKHFHSLQSRNVDGIVLFLEHDMDIPTLSMSLSERTEVLVVSENGCCRKYSDVFFSYENATKLATERLLELDHKHVALLGCLERNINFADMKSGYSKALYQHGISIRDEYICLCEDQQDIIKTVENLLFGKISAFVCADSAIAMHVYRILSRFGLQVPQNYSVLTLSLSPGEPELFCPPIAGMDMQYREVGHHAIRKLISAIEGFAPESQGALEPIPCFQAHASIAPPPVQRGKRIIVVGSMNMDVIIHTSHIPISGESLIVQKIINVPGGKGANQAVGAAKLGGDVYMIGSLGGDIEGRLLYSSLDENGINVAGVQTIHDKPSGKAYIMVAQDGESTIVVSHGTNKELKPALIEKNKDAFNNAEFCLLSTEIPWETVEYTIDLCVENDVKVILKPTLQEPISTDILKKIAFLILNEKELDVQVSGKLSVEEKVAQLYSSGAEIVIATLGEKGCYLHSAEIKRFFPAAKDFTAIDTTGAADAFISAFAVYLSEGRSIVSSIKFATYAAGISVTRDGVQPALAGRLALEMYSDRYESHWPS